MVALLCQGQCITARPPARIQDGQAARERVQVLCKITQRQVLPELAQRRVRVRFPGFGVVVKSRKGLMS